MKKFHWFHKKKSILLLVVIVTTLALLTACGGQKPAESSESKAPVSSSEVASISEATSEPEASTSSEQASTSEVTSTSEVASTTEVSTAQSEEDVRLVAMKGATAMGLVKYLDEEDKKEDDEVAFEMLTMPDEVATKLVKGEVDIAAVPSNLAATLFNKTKGQIQVLGVNVTNVLYIAENGDSVASLADLKGKTIYSTGKGSSPEAILNVLLKQAGLSVGEDVTVEYLSEASEVAAKLAATPGAIAQLQQPFLTTVTAKNESVRVVIDMNAEWKKAFGEDSGIVTGVVVARKEFLEKNANWVKQFLVDYKASVDWVLANVEEAGKMIGELEIVPAPVATKALPHNGIALITGESMQKMLSGYLTKLYETNPKLVGGELPTEQFYFLGN